MGWKEWVDESVNFYTERIILLNQKLRLKNLTLSQVSAIQSEKLLIINERKKWKSIQKELKND